MTDRLARIKSRFLDCDEEDADWLYQALAETIAIAECNQGRVCELQAQVAEAANRARMFVTRFDNLVRSQLIRTQSLIADAQEVLKDGENHTIRGYLERDMADKDALLGLFALATPDTKEKEAGQ